MSLALVSSPQNVDAKSMVAAVTKSAQGMGGALAWPALLRTLDHQDPGYKS
ncbi:Ribulose-5-phosphate 4-epimerase, putative [Pseudomonas orientalis]|nr:Ribulose-5-phosphate 4-epimerase, putative [Pseudomonas orientalis]